MKDRLMTLPVAMVERLMDIAVGACGVNDAPTLMLFSEARRRLKEAKRAGGLDVRPRPRSSWLRPFRNSLTC